MDVLKELFLMQQTYATLFSVTNKIQVAGDNYLEGLTTRQLMAITALAHLEEEERTINNVARKLGTTKQSVKQIITIMEQKGYVRTVPSMKDKRAVNIIVTEEGINVALKCSELGVYFIADVFKNFSSDEIETLWGYLKRLYRFDGEEQSGFESEGNLDVGDIDTGEIQKRIITEFKKLRNAKEES